MGKETKKQGLEGFLNSQFLEDYQNKTPSGYELIENYPLKPPFSYANILQNKETFAYLYQVDEVKLTHEEENVFHRLHNLIEENINSPEKTEGSSGFSQYLNQTIKENEKIFSEYPAESVEKVKYYLERDIAGFGLIDALMYDPNIEDVSCSGANLPIYIWHRKYDSIPVNIQFEGEMLNNFVSRIVFRAGKHISSAFPITDLALQGNHRISVLYQKEVTPKGTSFTIRKFKEDPYTVIDLVNFGTISLEMAAYLWMLVENKLSIIIIGSTGSGKTTILNAIAGLVNPDYKIFSVEDVSEINIEHDNWFSLVSRTGFGPNSEGEIGLYDLIKSGVRHRPDYIVVGEIRGSEAYVMFQAMATGHGGLCTMHADSLNSATKRLQQKPMDIPPAYISLMNCAIVVRRVKENTTGQSSRKVVTIEEIQSIEKYNSVFKWKPKTDFFEPDLEDSMLLKKISEQTSLDFEEILNEFEIRVYLLKWMRENNIRSYKKVADTIGKFYRDPSSIMKKIGYGV